MKRVLLKIVVSGSAIILLPLSIFLWILLATFIMGLTGLILLGTVHPEVLPADAKTVMPLVVLLGIFFLLGIPICAFWTHVSVMLWKRLWPEKFWFTKAARLSLWERFINLPAR